MLSVMQTWTAATILISLVATVRLLAPGAAFSEPAHPVAEVDGTVITDNEVQQSLGPALQQLQEQMYSMKRERLDALIAQRLLAKEAARRGISVAALLDAEVTSKVELVTEQEVEAFLQANRDRSRAQDEGTTREQVRAHLQRERLWARRAAFLQSLRGQATVVVRLQPPPIVRVEVPTGGAPTWGSADAPLSVVEFTDYHCPYCRRAQGTFTELTARFGGRLRFVHKDFPIDSQHPEASKAHAAARCAEDQGKFWEYRARLFGSPPTSADAALTEHARALGLDVTAFEECLQGGKHRATVERDIQDGKRLGVTATPTFYINGRQIVGAQPLWRFIEVIEDEFGRVRR